MIVKSASALLVLVLAFEVNSKFLPIQPVSRENDSREVLGGSSSSGSFPFGGSSISANRPLISGIRPSGGSRPSSGTSSVNRPTFIGTASSSSGGSSSFNQPSFSGSGSAGANRPSSSFGPVNQPSFSGSGSAGSSRPSSGFGPVNQPSFSGSGSTGGRDPLPCEEPCLKILKPVCGSNGNSYNNLCMLQNAACLNREFGGPSISFAYDGFC